MWTKLLLLLIFGCRLWQSPWTPADGRPVPVLGWKDGYWAGGQAGAAAEQDLPTDTQRQRSSQGHYYQYLRLLRSINGPSLGWSGSIRRVCSCSSGTWVLPPTCVWQSCWNTSVGRVRRHVKNSTEDFTFRPRRSTLACQQGPYKEVKTGPSTLS